MKSNRLIFLGAMLLLAFTASSAAGRKSGPHMQVVYQEQPTGEWQVFVFGLPHCPDPKNAQVIFPKDRTQPLEIECDVVK